MAHIFSLTDDNCKKKKYIYYFSPFLFACLFVCCSFVCFVLFSVFFVLLFVFSFLFPQQFCPFTCYIDGIFQSKFPLKDNQILSYFILSYMG